MIDFKICLGNKRDSLQWKNSYIKWEDFLNRIKNTVRTTETVEEYIKLPKGKRDEIKDIGGFVAGHISGTRRKKEKVLSRSMITLDMDEATTDFLEKGVYEYKFTWAIYSTHKHKPAAPRLRFIIPLNRDVTPEEYGAVSRMLAKDIGMEMMDKLSFSVNQMMYWPSTSMNGEYVFLHNDGELLDPDVILKKYDDWHDVSTWPLHPLEIKLVKEHQGNKKSDPLLAKGEVGAFCRCYTMAEALEKFLSDVYAPTGNPDRYSYIPADSSAGVQIYDDKFLYSHHASDPASDKELNAFEVVMVHKFKDLDEKAQFKAMCNFAREDEKVRIECTNMRIEEANKDFEKHGVFLVTEDAEKDDSWKGLLSFNKMGEVDNTLQNITNILINDPIFECFAFNDLARMTQFIKTAPWPRPTTSKFWVDHDMSQLCFLLEKFYGRFTDTNVVKAFDKVTVDRHFHPIRDYLHNLPKWDEECRVEDLFIKYMKAEDTPYIRTVTRKTFVAMVARMLRPGVKFDAIPVLDGAQGIGKSTIIRDLVGEDYYSDSLSLTDMSDKTGAEKLQGFWCVEIGELAGMKKADIEKVKAFITSQIDNYRPSYGRTVESHPRQAVVIATVNGENGYLRDITGNRRFWIIKLGQTEKKRRWKFDKDFRDQFWAEAKHYYEQGEKLYLEDEMQIAAENEQRKAMEKDPRFGLVNEYLNKLLPENWDDMNLYERRNFLQGDELSPKGTVERKFVSRTEIYSECLGFDAARMTNRDSYEISAIMMQISGWKKVEKARRIPIYGLQRGYERE